MWAGPTYLTGSSPGKLGLTDLGLTYISFFVGPGSTMLAGLELVLPKVHWNSGTAWRRRRRKGRGSEADHLAWWRWLASIGGRLKAGGGNNGGWLQTRGRNRWRCLLEEKREEKFSGGAANCDGCWRS